MSDQTFSKLIFQVDCIISKASETGSILTWQETNKPLKRLNRCQKLTMAQRDMVIERNWASALGEREALEIA